MDRDRSRTANLLGAFAVALTDAIRRDAEASSGHGLSGAAALTTVTAYPGEPLATLARTLGLSAAGTSRLADRLELGGLIRREGGGKDGRMRSVVPTPTGEERAKHVLDARRKAIRHALTPLSAEQVGQLATLLDAMLAALTPDRATCDHTCRLCEVAACPQDACPVELAARITEARK